MNKYIFSTISLVTLGISIASCKSGSNATPAAPPRAFANLAMGKCESYNVSVQPSIYLRPTPHIPSIEFNSTLRTSLEYWEDDSMSNNKFHADTTDNPVSWYPSLLAHPNDCTLGTIEGIHGNSRGGPWDNKLMIFSSCKPKLKSSPITQALAATESSQLMLDFIADYRIESPEDYNTESPVILRSGTIHFSCPYTLQDAYGNPLPTNSHIIVTAK